MRPTVIAVCTLALGVGIGFVVARYSSPSVREQGTSDVTARLDAIEAQLGRQAPQVAARSHLDQEALREAIRGVLRDELRTAQQVQELEAPDEEEDDEAAAAQRVAYERGVAVLDSALAAQRWRDEDRRDLRRAMDAMSDAQREQILARLFTALNRRELRPDPGVSPL